MTTTPGAGVDVNGKILTGELAQPHTRAEIKGEMMNDEFMTGAEVAELLKLHLKTVYKLAEHGDIPGARIGRSWRFRRADVLGLVPPSNGKDR